MPQQLTVGIAVHQSVRSKQLVNITGARNGSLKGLLMWRRHMRGSPIRYVQWAFWKRWLRLMIGTPATPCFKCLTSICVWWWKWCCLSVLCPQETGLSTWDHLKCLWSISLFTTVWITREWFLHTWQKWRLYQTLILISTKNSVMETG